jgi:hypothetical protein
VPSLPYDTYLLKIVLPWEDTDRALTHLNRMNVNYATMYPDLGGAALHARLTSLSPNYEGLNPPDEPLMRPRPVKAVIGL